MARGYFLIRESKSSILFISTSIFTVFNKGVGGILHMGFSKGFIILLKPGGWWLLNGLFVNKLSYLLLILFM